MASQYPVDLVPVIRAIKKDDTTGLRRVLDRGIDALRFSLNPRGQVYSEFPLYWAVSQNQTQAVALLLEHGADANCPDSIGNSALFWAQSAELLSLLLGKGADVNTRNSYGSTRLHRVANGEENDLRKKCEVLLDHGADKSLTDSAGRTAETCARSKGYDQLADFIRDHASARTVPKDVSRTPRKTPATAATTESAEASRMTTEIDRLRGELNVLQGQLRERDAQLRAKDAEIQANGVELMRERTTVSTTSVELNIARTVAKRVPELEQALRDAEAETAMEIRLANQRTTELRDCQEVCAWKH